MERYYNENGDLAVLVSHDFGAGWSTWHVPALAYDKRIVEYWIANPKASEKEVEEYLESIGYDNVYAGGYYQIQLEYVPKGSIFRISEYDGRELIEYQEDGGWIIA